MSEFSRAGQPTFSVGRNQLNAIERPPVFAAPLLGASVALRFQYVVDQRVKSGIDIRLDWHSRLSIAVGNAAPGVWLSRRSGDKCTSLSGPLGRGRVALPINPYVVPEIRQTGNSAAVRLGRWERLFHSTLRNNSPQEQRLHPAAKSLPSVDHHDRHAIAVALAHEGIGVDIDFLDLQPGRR